MVSATLKYSQKVTLIHRKTEHIAVAEIKVWVVKATKDYPQGIKYSLFCVNLETKEVIIGFDNHKPKGPHKHLGDHEVDYSFDSTDQLLDDFWNEIKKRGYVV